MPTITQENWPMAVATPLGPHVLSLVGFTADEFVSQLFHFQLDLIAENTASVPFENLLGQSITVELGWSGSPQPRSEKRFFNGICSRMIQGERDQDFTSFRMELVPKMWLLTRRAQSRIFQHINVPDILKKVLTGLDVDFKLQGAFQPRDYCVQYRETDFNFACRLMEEEGIYFYFQHPSPGKHTLVLANTPAGHVDLPDPRSVLYHKAGPTEGGFAVEQWEKVQELRSGKYTLWDHCFELPHKHLEASKTIMPSVQVGEVTHKLQVSDNGKLEIRDWPGGYAQRFDGVDKGGGPQAAEVQKIFQDNARTVALRMEEEGVLSLSIQGAGNCRNFVAGHKFNLTTLSGSLEKEFKADGDYVLTHVRHAAKMSGYRSSGAEFVYDNRFTCIPAALPFRPQRTSRKPVVQGTQTAVVVGPAGEEIFTDQYSRVKVQFHWDAEGKNNADSACWCRVGTPWAGKHWGMIHIPRIGQEVIVAFEEGDPDKPIIVGSVYNAEQMPPFSLPDHKTQSGIQTRSSLGGSPESCNEICFEDKKGAEFLYIRAEKDQIFAVENDQHLWAGNDRTKEIGHDETTNVHHDRTETVDNNETISIGGDRKETVGSNETIAIGANRTETVGKNESITVALTRTRMVGINESVTVGAAQEITVGGLRAVTVGAAQAITVGASETESYGSDHTQSVGGGQAVTVAKDGTYAITGGRSTSVGKDDSLKVAQKLIIDAGEEIIIKTGDASIAMKKDGTIEIKGKDILVQGSGKITEKADGDFVIKGSKVGIN